MCRGNPDHQRNPMRRYERERQERERQLAERPPPLLPEIERLRMGEHIPGSLPPYIESIYGIQINFISEAPSPSFRVKVIVFNHPIFGLNQVQTEFIRLEALHIDEIDPTHGHISHWRRSSMVWYRFLEAAYSRFTGVEIEDSIIDSVAKVASVLARLVQPPNYEIS